ncbi:uncharacterized protein LOC128741073 [Sabethes cyaneus]|uniref:uncharacterized protein LOC128741073 n=1 Tax=Sabethes cyaneus TaxID=53552 RepID=UPI00237D3460|nr:uncharacterized protein LOC128741073 [Sabethes cyaneus]
MSSKSLDLTTTPCEQCKQISTENEAMIACDNCDQWYHTRCVGITTMPKKDKKWFCPDDSCQAVYQEKLKKNRDKKNPTPIPPTVAEKLKAMDAERKGKEEEMEAEWMIKQKEIEINNALKEKQMRLDCNLREQQLESARQLREKEMEEKRILFETELREKQEHFEEMKLMEAAHREKLSKLEMQMAKVDFKRKPSNNKKSGSQDIQPSTSKKSPKERRPGKLTKEILDRFDKNNGGEEDEDESSDGDFDDDSDASDNEQTVDGDNDDDENKSHISSQNGQGPQRIGPSRAQLSARNGLTRKLPTFTGKPEEWPLFFGAYQASNEACGYSDVENLVRLQESLKGAALESVRGQLLLPKSVPRVITKLRQLYGRPEQLLQSHLERVRKLDSPRADRLASFIPFGNAVEQLCEHLEAAELTLHLVNPILIQDLVSKLPDGEKRQWLHYKRKKKEVTLRTFTDFISKIVSDACEANVNYEYKPDIKAAAGTSGKAKPKEKAALYSHIEASGSNGRNDRQKQKPCRACQRDDHRLRFCQDFKNLSFADRMKIVTKWKLCRVCLNEHSGQCRFKIRCDVDGCGESHNSLIHPATVAVAMHAHINPSGTTMFRMIPVMVHCGEKSLVVLAFLDEGASITLIETELADRLGLGGVKEKLVLNWTADVYRVEKNSRRMNLWMSAVDEANPEKNLLRSVYTVDKLRLPHQALKADELSAQYDHMRGLPISSYDGRPAILIGLSNIHAFAPLEAKIGTISEPIAVRCQLGWTVYGPRRASLESQGHYLGYHQEVSNEDLHDLLKNHHALEESVVRVQRESAEDKRARSILEQTTKRVGDHFETGLLWMKDDVSFPDSYPMALKRLKQLERKLEKSPELYQNVRKQINEYQAKGYAHEATEAELRNASPEKVWYLPLKVVLNPKKPDKVRLIWDAAAMVQGISLNSMLLKGPDLLVPLVSVLLNFRERRVAFGGDIREMYHQMKMVAKDKSAQWFLFRNNSAEKPKVYVMDVATFGSTCSPASAQYVKNRNAEEHAGQFPEAAVAIIKRHYVDDYFDSADTVQEAVERAKQVRFIHKKAGFDIRNWVSNSSEVLTALGDAKPGGAVVFNLDKSSSQKSNERVLGVSWEEEADVFAFSATPRPEMQAYLCGETRPTKRNVLSCVMGFFDPLGLLSPFTIHGKILVQHLWRSGCEWDQEIDERCWNLWQQWVGLLPEVETLRIPRCFLGCAKSTVVESLELHIFTDASEHAYGCVTYLRSVVDGEVNCSLVMSRAKVAPLKRQSIPRLELMAAVLGARMSQTFLETTTLHIDRTTLWTDSRTVLSWLQSDQYKYKQFVAFRVGEILELTNMRDWRWVPTKQNVADVLTKWGRGPPLQNESEWVKGPTMLYQLRDQWPVIEPSEDTIEEARGLVMFHEVVDVSAISRWTKLVRVTATVVRFIINCRRKKAGEPIVTSQATEHHRPLIKARYSTVQLPLQQEELRQAETVLWKQSQFASFPEEMNVLTANLKLEAGQPPKRIEKSSVLYKCSPILDAEGVLRLRGRMESNEVIPFDKKFRIILSGRHEITQKLILHYYVKFGHAYRETVFNELRQKFWIQNARTAIRRATETCVWCKVHRCVPTAPMMGPLPVHRTTTHLRPFSAVGVDYLGPVEVTIGRRTEKRWVVVFTCMAVRAVHLDVVYSLSTQSCLMAIRRFVSKRGDPDHIFSDNATCFHGANTVMMKEIEKVHRECAERATSSITAWHFNPPSTPHMGGVWEWMVRSVKEALRVLDDGRKLTDEILVTALAEAEDMINHRPLTYIPQESAGEEAISPNHFIRGTVTKEDAVLDNLDQYHETLRNMYHRSRCLASKLWERWSQEYLPTLNHRPKWFEDTKPLEVGDLVFMVEGKNRKYWRRGRVQEIVKGADGRIRQADVRTADGKVYRRAVANLAVMEIQDGKSGSAGGSTGCYGQGNVHITGH